MKNLIYALFILAGAVSVSFAAETKSITLKDGSVVRGEIVGMDNGRYTVKTAAMGEINLLDADIASIVSGQPAAAPQGVMPEIPATAGNLASMPEFQNMQAKLLSNPAIMAEIQKLIENPEIMAIMSDPGFAQAVQSGNLTTLQNDPRLKTLADMPVMQELVDKIKSGQEK